MWLQEHSDREGMLPLLWTVAAVVRVQLHKIRSLEVAGKVQLMLWRAAQ